MALYNRYQGYLDNEDERPRAMQVLGTALKVTGAAALGVLGARFLIQSGLLQRFSDEVAPRLIAYGYGIGRGEATRRAGESAVAAIRRGAAEELAQSTSKPFVSQVLEQRAELFGSMAHAPVRVRALVEVEHEFGPVVARGLRRLLEGTRASGVDYLEDLARGAIADADFMKDVSSFLPDAGAARRLYNLLVSGASAPVDMAKAPFAQKIDEIIVSEMAKRSARPSFLHRLLGIRPASVGDLLASGVIESDEELSGLLARFPQLGRAVGDPSMFITESGELLDLRNFARMNEALMGWAGRTLPGKILHLEDVLASRRAPFIYRVFKGSVQPFATGDMEPLVEDALVIGSRMVRAYHPEETIAEDVELLLHGGATERLVRHMLGLEPEPESTAPSVIGRIAQRLGIRDALDLGNQDQSSALDQLVSRFTKFREPHWYGNVFARVLGGGEFTEQDLRAIERFFQEHTEGLSDQALRVIEEALPGRLRGLSLHSAQDVLRAAELLGSNALDLESLRVAMHMGEQVSLRSARQRVSHEILRRADVARVRALIDRAVAEGILTRAQAQQALDVVNVHLFSLARDVARVPGQRERAANLLRELFSGAQPGSMRFQREVAGLVQREAGGWRRGLVTVPPRLNAGRYVVMRRGRSLSAAFAETRRTNEYTSLLGWLRQWSAGRRNLQDVTINTLVPYHLLERVNRALVPSGLALGPQSLGSVGDIFSGLILKRVLPAYVGLRALSYLNWEVGKFTGKTAEQRYNRARAELALAGASAQDALGITRLRKGMARVLPGIEVLGDIPFIGVPFRKARSREELEEYLRYGEEPVRQGRFWLLSSSPWRGGRIQQFRPNWYRMGISQYKMTDVLYGSPEEYWSHSILPTPRYPFSPLVALLDPYYLERKHYKDRPYPVTGPPMSDEVLFGPVINATLGRIIKPRRRMHQAELRAMNEEEERKGAERRSRGDERYLVREVGGELQVSMPVPGLAEGPGSGPATAVRGTVGTVARGGRGGLVYGGSRTVSAGGSALGVAGSNAAVRALAASGGRGGAGFVEVRGGDIRQPMGEPAPYGTLAYDLGQYGRNVRNLLGIWGWGMDLAGFETRPQLVMASAGTMYSMERAWRDLAMGGTVLQFGFGLGLGEVSEIGRRFLTRRPAAIQLWNPIPNQMPSWIPGSNYFLDLRHGDPYAAVPGGEYRLPGEGYEATHPLYPDVDSELGYFTRFAILSDVAPWSNEWRAYSRIVSQRREELPSYLQRRVSEIRRQIAARKRHYDLYPYRFLGRRTSRITGTVAEFIDPSTFTISQMPGVPIRLAGASLTQQHPISDYLKAGQHVSLVVNADEKRSRDMLRTLRATVYVGPRNLNLELLQSGVAREKETDWSAAGVEARFTREGRAVGALWERIAHLDIPILHRKFLPIDSPLEYYERRLVYGKEFATWEHPYSDYLGPTFEAYAQKNPLFAAVLGGFTGALLGWQALGGGLNTKYGAVAGAALAGTLSAARGAYQLFTGQRWVPERVRRRWDIETYFDILEYAKYRGIYEYAARRAMREEDTDIDLMYRQAEATREARRKLTNMALRRKRAAMMARDKERVSAINAVLREIREAPGMLGAVGPWGRMAILARQRYESTLYGADIGNVRDVVRALPATSREFYQHFVQETDPRRRRRILSIVPPLERRLYQKQWGMPVDRLPDLKRYFRTHRLPRPDWAGWRPEVDLNLTKLRVVKNEGLDMHDYGFYPMDELQARFAPGISRPFRIQHYSGGIEHALRSVLKGYGLQDISIESMPIEAPDIAIDFDLMVDRSDEISDYVESGEWAS